MPEPHPTFDAAESAPWEERETDPVALGVIPMSTVQPERIEWLWPGRIPRGKLTIVEGDPKVGKSTLMLELAARVTTGTPLPDGHRPTRGDVLIMTAEDGLADTVRPRLDAAGADVKHVHAWESVPDYDEVSEQYNERSPSIPRDLGHLETLINQYDVALVVVDVLNAYLGSDVDGHKDQDIRRALMPLAKLAERTSTAVVVLRHLNKSTGGPGLYRGAGSIGIGGAARSILLVALDPDDETDRRRVLASLGSNVAAPPEALAYELVSTEEKGCARVSWVGVSEHSTATLLAGNTEEERSQLTEACDVLLDILAEGPVSAKDVLRRGQDAGVAVRTLKRAKAHLGVESRKGASEWTWYPPEGGHGDPQEDQPPTVGTLGTLGTLAPEQGVLAAQGGQDNQGCQGGQGLGTGTLDGLSPIDRAPAAAGARRFDDSDEF